MISGNRRGMVPVPPSRGLDAPTKACARNPVSQLCISIRLRARDYVVPPAVRAITDSLRKYRKRDSISKLLLENYVDGVTR